MPVGVGLGEDFFHARLRAGRALLHKSLSAGGLHRAMSQSLHPKPRYFANNGEQYNAALKARGFLTIWLDKCMSWFAAVGGKSGRMPKFSDAAIHFCLTI